MREPTWTLVVPVKRLAVAKTRLRGALSGSSVAPLALAFAQDTVAAAVCCPAVTQVLVVTNDPAAARPVAALAADLPALRPAELAAALAAAGHEPGRAYVPDAAGTGTTLLAAGAGGPLDPLFGPGSAAAHAASGARPLAGDWPTLRRDVDTPADLAAAVALGPGAHTRALLHPRLLAADQGRTGVV